MSLRDQIIKGTAWRFVGRVANQLVQFGIAVILARLLTPEDYGLVAMATVFLAFAGIFEDFGLSVALIQKKEITDKHESTLFWTNLAAGCTIFILFCAGSPLIAWFYNEAILANIVPFMALAFVIMPLFVVQRALMMRRMDFRSIALIEVSTTAVTGGVGVVLALNGYGVWSLVVSGLSGKLVQCILSHWRCRWVPSLVYDVNALKSLFKFGGNFTVYGFINYIGSSLDRLLIGKFMGAQSVGLYGRAHALMMTPFSQIVWVLTSVLFPAFSSIQDDKNRVKNIFLRALEVTGFLVAPMLVCLMFLAEPFVSVVFGKQWLEVVPVLQIFCVLGFVQLVIQFIGPIIESQGKTELLVKLSLFQTLLSLCGVVFGVVIARLDAVAIGLVTSNLIILYPYIKYGGGLVSIKVSDILRSLSGALFCASIMICVVLLLNKYFVTTENIRYLLAINTAMCVAVYMVIMIIVKPRGYIEIKKIMKRDKTDVHIANQM